MSALLLYTCPQSSFERPPLHMPRPDTSHSLHLPLYSNTQSIYAIQVPNMQHKLYCINAVEDRVVPKHGKSGARRARAILAKARPCPRPVPLYNKRLKSVKKIILKFSLISVYLQSVNCMPFKCQTCNTSFNVQMQLKKHV